MSNPQPTRAEIYERIKSSSKQEVILEEMQRMGFWPRREGQPELAADLIQREGELQRELGELRQQLAVRKDPERALREMRKQRMKEAREGREQTKCEQAKARHEKALAWHAKRANHVGYLGPGVSGDLTPTDVEQPGQYRVRKPIDPARLALHGLPALNSGAQLAEAMGVTVAELRFLSFHREVARTHHYHSFTLPKKTGGERLISAPMPRLKRAQYWVLDNVLAKVPAHDAAHGFLPGRSIISNAQPHAGRDVVINLDVKDFFPSISFGRIKGVFQQLGYGGSIATILALLCSENRAQAWEVDGERLFVGGKARERVLPQGAPTSPMLTNLLCRRLDRRLLGMATKLGFTYTRYADDLTFSASGAPAQELVGRLLRQARFVLREEGFTPHPDKEHVMRKGSRQEVTGLVVNGSAPSVSRQTRRQLRAALHRATHAGAHTGAEKPPAHWQGQAAQPSQLLGLAQFVYQIDPRQGQSLLAQAKQLTRSPLDRANDALLAAADIDRQARGAPGEFRRLAAAGKAPARADGKTWWQPAERPAPVHEKTDQQRKEERQLARQPAAQAPLDTAWGRGDDDVEANGSPVNRSTRAQRQASAQAQAQAASATTPPPRKMMTYWAQILICFFAGSVFHNRLITIIAMVGVVALYYARKQRWDVFAGILVLATFIGFLIRF